MLPGMMSATIGYSEAAVARGRIHVRDGRVAFDSTATYTFLYATKERLMRTMTYSESRAKYAETLNAVVDDREEVVITRAGHDPVVIVSLEDYEALKETAYLLRSPANARRLLESINRLEAGEGVERDPIE